MIAIILGTRPEIVKMSPIIRECEKKRKDFFILHTGQHYSYNMDKIFFDQLNLTNPRYRLEVGPCTQSIQTANMMIGIEQVLIKEKPDIVLVQGDTNSVLAGALVASKLNIKIGHVEAGLRSYDKNMPEELNRILTDHCSDYLFAPTGASKKILINEGISKDKIWITGNTIVDAMFQNRNLSKNTMLTNLGIDEKEYILVTAHRQENVDSFENFRNIVYGINLVAKKFNVPIIYPVHPRSRKMMETFELRINSHVVLIDPLDYLGFIQLEASAKLILTDSGGIQEEACILGVPCVTMRNNTERPETIEVGSNILSGTHPSRILECAVYMLGKHNVWINPFGDGTASEKIVNKCGE